MGASAAASVVAGSWRPHQRDHIVPSRCAVPERALKASKRQETFVTYNVLCNHLIHPGFLKKCPAADLESNVRLQRVQDKLLGAVSVGALIGLQEVSMDWAGELYVFFARHGYQVVFVPYGEAFNGRMGVVFAYPSDRFVTETIRLHHVGDSLPEVPSLAPTTPPHLSAHGVLSADGMEDILGIRPGALDLQSRYAPHGPTVEALNPRQDREWGLAVRRQNVAVLARLRPRGSPHGLGSDAFCVGVYHMPCLYRSCEERQTQNIHILALKKAIVDMSRDSEEPCVLLGDFNIKPKSSAYNLMTGSRLGHEEAPDSEQYRRVYTNRSFTSAYAALHGGEPGPHTLDYIWMSEGCHACFCPQLDPTEQRPSASEPSDHPMLLATVELPTNMLDLSPEARDMFPRDVAAPQLAV